MNITEEVKELIANGKTEEALEWLQTILKEKDTNLLNQTYLLQSQYIDIQKRLRLGLQDASTDLQRVNFTLLTICDDVEKAGITGEKKRVGAEVKNDTKSEIASSLKTTYWIFGIIVFIAIASIAALVIYSKGGKNDGENRANTPEKSNNAVKNKELWLISPVLTKIEYKIYGTFNVEIREVFAEMKDADTKILTFNLKVTCEKMPTDNCKLSYLEYRFVKPDGDKIAPISDALYVANELKTGGSTFGVVKFNVPRKLQQANLQVYFTGEEAETSNLLKLMKK
jgi:Effector-associated domain 11